MGAPAGAADRPGDLQGDRSLPPSHPAPVGTPAAEAAPAVGAAGKQRQLGPPTALEDGLDLGLGNPYDQHVVFGEGP